MSKMREEIEQLKKQLETYEVANRILYNKAHENMSVTYYFVKEIYPKLSKDEAERICKEYNISNETIQGIANIVKNAEKANNDKKKSQTKQAKVENSAKDDDIDPNYKVGYKKPPRETRFQKGNKGNPKGRKTKKGVPIEDFLLRDLDTKATIVENGKKKRVYKREIVSKTILKQMLNGESVSRNNINLLKQLDGHAVRRKVFKEVFKKSR